MRSPSAEFAHVFFLLGFCLFVGLFEAIFAAVEFSFSKNDFLLHEFPAAHRTFNFSHCSLFFIG